MLLGPNMMRSQGLLPLLNSSSVFGTKASSGMTSTSILIPSLSYRSFSTSDSEYFTYSAFTTALIVVPSYGFPCAGAPGGRTPTARAATSVSTSPTSASRFMSESPFVYGAATATPGPNTAEPLADHFERGLRPRNPGEASEGAVEAPSDRTTQMAGFHRPVYPLVPPSARPLTRYRCSMKATANAGRTPRTTDADASP